MKTSVLMFCPEFRRRFVITGVHLNQNGGAERHAETLAAALAAASCRVTILTPRYDPDLPDMEKSNDGATRVSVHRIVARFDSLA